jgi:hypothetical protein
MYYNNPTVISIIQVLLILVPALLAVAYVTVAKRKTITFYFNKIKGLYLNKIKGLPFSLLRFIPGTRYLLTEKKRKPFSFFYSSAFLYQIPSDPNIRVIFIPIKEKVKKISFFKKVLKIIAFFFVALFLKSLCQYSLGAEQTILEILILNLYSPYS